MEKGGSIHGYGTNNNKSASSSGLKMKMKQGDEVKNKGKGSKKPLFSQELLVPVANVTRIMRKVVPAHGKISDESKETIQECVSEFIMFVTGEANEKCKAEQRKTVTADDILWAIGKLGFDHYVDPLNLFIRRYRETEFERTPVGEMLFKMPPEPKVPEKAPLQAGVDREWFLEEAAMADYFNIGKNAK